MAADNDLTHIDEPRTNREVLQDIVHMIRADKKDRADDRDMLEAFITTQRDFNKAIELRVRTLEDGNIAVCKDVSRLREESKKWDITNTIVALIAAIAAAFGLRGS